MKKSDLASQYMEMRQEGTIIHQHMNLISATPSLSLPPLPLCPDEQSDEINVQGGCV